MVCWTDCVVRPGWDHLFLSKSIENTVIAIIVETCDRLGSHAWRLKVFLLDFISLQVDEQNLILSPIGYEKLSLVFLIFSDILPFLQASQVITVNEQLPLTPVEPEVMTERRTVKICCCIPKGDVLLNAWYVNKFLFFLYSEALCMLVDPQKFHLMLRAMTSWPVADVCCQYSIFYSNLRHMQAEIK